MRTAILAVAFGVIFAGYAHPVSAETAITGVSVSAVTTSYEGWSLGWSFTPTQDIVVTKLGTYFMAGVDGLYYNHFITIYDSSGQEQVSGTIVGYSGNYVVGVGYVMPSFVLEDGYTYVDVSAQNVQLNAGQTYVIASYWSRVPANWWDNDITTASATLSSLITPGPVGLRAVGQVMPTIVVSAGAYLSANFQFELASTPSMEVQIDIKPGSYPNSINLGSNGVVPVAILSDVDFDATTVDPATVSLAGAGVAVRGKGSRYMADSQDVDGDGLLDLVLHVETENLNPDDFQDGYAVIGGTTYDGVPITGRDEISIVPVP